MTDPAPDRPDPRTRPDDPAGTKPKVDPASLLPAVREPLLSAEPADGEVVDGDLLPERIDGFGPPARAEPRAESPHAPRFQFLLGAFFALALAAVAAVVVLALHGKETSPPDTWSAWKPAGSDPLTAIAQHVGGQYHLADGDQLVLVTGGPLSVQSIPLTIVLHRASNYAPVTGKGVLYRLCGFGPRCAIRSGKPTLQRGLLVRREALELALYTFHFTDVDNVVVFMPPPRGKKQNNALLFRRKDVDPVLSRPLDRTLTRTAPLPTTMYTSPDASNVDRITRPLQFSFSFSQANGDQSGFLVLAPET